jgi:hypothetical protein
LSHKRDAWKLASFYRIEGFVILQTLKKTIAQEEIEKLSNLKVLVINALREELVILPILT